MPRIPSVSDVSPVSAGVARDPGVRASAEDFGLDMARGISGAGRGLEDLGDGIEARRRKAGDEEERRQMQAFLDKFRELNQAQEQAEEAEAKAQTEQHRVEVRQAAIQMIDDLEYDGGAPLTAAAQSARELEALEEDKLKVLPPERRAAARAASAPIREGHGIRAAQRLQNQKVAALGQGTTDTLTLLKSQAAADPGAAEKLTADGLGLLSQLHQAGALNDAQLERQSTAFRRELYTEMLRAQKAGDVVADLEAGIYDAVLDDPDLKQQVLIENRWRMRGEEAQGRVSGEAMVASAARGDGAETKFSDATERLLAAEDFADFELEAEKALRVRSGVETLRFAPEDAFDGEIAKLAPAVAALDKEARLEIQEAVRRGGERLLEERRADPADYVMSQPTVAQAFAEAKEDPSLLPLAVSRRLAAQAAMGTSPEDQRALTKAEAAEILQGYQALPEAARNGALKALRDAYGDEIGRVAAELEEAGLPLQLVQALDPASKGVSSGQTAEVPQLSTSGPEGEIINEIAERLIAESKDRSVPPLPGRKPTPPGEDMNLDRLPRFPLRNPKRDPGHPNLSAADDPIGSVGDEGLSRSSGSSADSSGGANQAATGSLNEGQEVDEFSPTGSLDETVKSELQEESEESFFDAFSLRAAVRDAPLDPAFDPFRNLPPLPESPREQAETIFKAMGLIIYVPEGEDAPILLDIARDLWSLRQRFEAGGSSVLKQFQEKVRDFSRVATAKHYQEVNRNAMVGGLEVFAETVLDKPERYLWSLSDNQLDRLFARALKLSGFTEGGEMASSAMSAIAPPLIRKVGDISGVFDVGDALVSQISGNYAKQLSLANAEQFRRGILRFPPGSASEKMMIELTGVTPIR